MLLSLEFPIIADYMLRFLDRYDLWDTLRSLAGRVKGPRYVAAPYLGSGGSALLPLNRGDVLICALTEQNSRNGSDAQPKLLSFKRGE